MCVLDTWFPICLYVQKSPSICLLLLMYIISFNLFHLLIDYTAVMLLLVD